MINIVDFILLIILILNIIFGYYLFVGWYKKTPFYPSSTKKLDKIFDQLKIDPKNKNFIDLGSGDGRFVVWASRKGFLNSFGVELNPFLTLFSKFRIILKRLKNAHIITGDFTKINFSSYDIVYFYIYSEHMENIRKKLYKELKPGSIIISSVFQFPNIKPNKVIDKYRIYIVEK